MLNMPTVLFDSPVRGFSNVTDRDAFALEQSSGANHYDRLDVVVRTAKGSWITDISGKRYLDCLAAYSAAN